MVILKLIGILIIVIGLLLKMDTIAIVIIPALSIGLVAFAVAQFTKLGGLVGLVIGSVIALILAFAIAKEHPKYLGYESINSAWEAVKLLPSSGSY